MRSHRSEFLVALLSALIAAIVAGIVLPCVLNTEQIRRSVAQQAITEYYQQVPNDALRRQVWQTKTTADWRNTPRGAWPEYDKWWSTVKHVDVDKVHPQDGANNFRVTLTYQYRNVTKGTEDADFHLKCSWWIDHLPGVQCGVQNIKIDDTAKPISAVWQR